MEYPASRTRSPNIPDTPPPKIRTLLLVHLKASPNDPIALLFEDNLHISLLFFRVFLGLLQRLCGLAQDALGFGVLGPALLLHDFAQPGEGRSGFLLLAELMLSHRLEGDVGGKRTLIGLFRFGERR